MARTAHPILMTIGLTIRSLRHEQGLSQETLAELADLDRSYMSSVERGLRNISVLNVARIATALRVPLRDLIGPREVASRPAGSVNPAPMREREPVVASWSPGRYLSLG